jgi:outer membrane protein assembly factor BamB
VVLLLGACGAADEGRPPVPVAPSTASPLWSFEQKDVLHSRRSTLRVPSDPVLRWSRRFEEGISDPVRFAVDGLGRIMVRTQRAASMLTAEGEDLWRFPSPARFVTDVVWPSADVILVANDRLRSLDLQGVERWSVGCDDPTFTPWQLVVDPQQNVYYLCHSVVQSVTRDGQPRWSAAALATTDDNLPTRPFFFADRLVVYSLRSAIAMSPMDGSVQWRTSTADHGIQSAPYGVVVEATESSWWLSPGRRMRIARDGAVLEAVTDSHTYGSVARLSHGVVAATENGVQAWDEAGAPLWNALLPRASMLVVDADDTVVVATTDRHLVALRDGQTVWSRDWELPGAPAALAIGGHGDILLGTDQSGIACLGQRPP